MPRPSAVMVAAMHVDLPTAHDISLLLETRSDHCVSIYLPTEPTTEDAEKERIGWKNQSSAALRELEQRGVEKAELELFEELLQEPDDDDWVWDHQANTLAVFTDGQIVRSFHLANRLAETTKVADRFFVKPLLRAVSFPQACNVLALAEGSVRVLEIGADFGPYEVDVPDLPTDAASAVGKASIADRSAHGRIQGSEGKKVRVGQYARKVDRAVRHALRGIDLPLILAAAEPTASIFREVNTSPQLAERAIEGSPERVSDLELATAARETLDLIYADQLRDLHELFELRTGQDRTATDTADLAREATLGSVHTLFVDIDVMVRGSVDDAGIISLDDGPHSYDVIDEIARRVLAADGRVLAVRSDEVPGGGDAAAILRWA